MPLIVQCLHADITYAISVLNKSLKENPDEVQAMPVFFFFITFDCFLVKTLNTHTINAPCSLHLHSTDCDATLDLAFIVDRSGSICGNGEWLYEENGKQTCDNWKLTLDFMTDAVKQMDIGEDQVRVAVVIFGNHGHLMWDLQR